MHAGEVLLRDVEPGDVEVFFAHQRDPEATRMAAFPARDHHAFSAHWARILDDATVAARTIVAGGEVAGNVVSWSEDGQRLVGYWIGREHWGRGVATAALQAFVAEREERPLHARVAEANAGSIRVLAKCGFVPTGERSEGDDGVAEAVFVLR
jgi:RimJ/RimL family protein N-acetyltransferase